MRHTNMGYTESTKIGGVFDRRTVAVVERTNARSRRRFSIQRYATR